MWYEIKSTDKSEWLSSLAQKYLGDWQKYPLIYEQNKDVLYRGPDHIEPGMKIWIPVDGKPRPGSAPKSTASSGATLKPGGLNTNQMLMIGGGVMAVIAIFLAFKK